MTQAAEKTRDAYTYWRNALAGNFGDVHDDEPQPGFYRKRISKGGPFYPIAIWAQGGKMMAKFMDGVADASEIWTFCCQHPITEAEYRKVAEQGGQWSDLDDAVAGQVSRRNSVDADPADVLKDQIDGALERLSEYDTITSDEQSSKAQSLRSRLLELKGEAEKTHKVEKAPHLEAGRAVDKKWFPLRDEAESGANTLRKAMSAWETKKLDERREAERKAEQERLKAEAEAKAAEEAGKPAPEPVPAPEPEETPVTATTIRGGYGRAASVKTVKVATVTDQDKAYAYAPIRNHPELVALITKLAQRAVDAGHDIPGVDVSEEAKVT